MTANQQLALATLLSSLFKYRAKDFAQAPTDATHVAINGKFKGQVTLLVALSLVDASFPDVVISQRGGFDLPAVASYPESKLGTCRYNDALPANALCAAIYGDMHLAKVGYGRKVTSLSLPVPVAPVPAVVPAPVIDAFASVPANVNETIGDDTPEVIEAEAVSV